VQSTPGLATSRQGDINCLARQLLVQQGGLQYPTTCIDGLLYLLFNTIDFLSCGRPLLSGQGTQLFELLGEQAFLAKIAYPHIIKDCGITSLRDRLQCLLFKFVQAAHLFALLGIAGPLPEGEGMENPAPGRNKKGERFNPFPFCYVFFR
jgi:hypothetical protein